MAQVRSARAMKTSKEKTRIHNLLYDWANKANQMFIIWLCWLLWFWKGTDWELEVCTATYGPGINQSQHMKSVSYIIKINIKLINIIIILKISRLTHLIVRIKELVIHSKISKIKSKFFKIWKGKQAPPYYHFGTYWKFNTRTGLEWVC